MTVTKWLSERNNFRIQTISYNSKMITWSLITHWLYQKVIRNFTTNLETYQIKCKIFKKKWLIYKTRWCFNRLRNSRLVARQTMRQPQTLTYACGLYVTYNSRLLTSTISLRNNTMISRALHNLNGLKIKTLLKVNIKPCKVSFRVKRLNMVAFLPIWDHYGKKWNLSWPII